MYIYVYIYTYIYIYIYIYILCELFHILPCELSIVPIGNINSGKLTVFGPANLAKLFRNLI